MQLEQQLTPLTQARRLDELGFKGESYYVWVEWGKLSDPVKRAEIHTKEVMDNRVCLADAAYRLFPALSVPELIDTLPAWTEVYKIPKTYDGNQYNVVSDDYEDAQWLAPELAEALSKYIICLIEQGLYIVNKE